MKDILQSGEFREISKSCISNMVSFLLERELEFGVMAETDHLRFDPELPPEIMENFDDRLLFVLAGYTLQSASVGDGFLSFEAGFGEENYGSLVSIPLIAVRQVYIDGYPVAINSAVIPAPEASDPERSMEALLSNPENLKLLKKKRKG